MARAIHETSRRRARSFIRVNSAALPTGAGRKRAVRLREGRVHRRRDVEGRTSGTGAPGHPVPRRGRRAAARGAAEAAARGAGTGVRAARRHRRPARRRAPHRGDQPRPRGDGGPRHVSERSLLPAERVPDPDSAAARAPRGHSVPGAPFRRRVFARARPRRSRRSPPARSRRCSDGRGPATSASCRT